MNILLTGATGFIGAAFTRLALRKGHRVAGLILPTENIPASLPAQPELVWVRGTLDAVPWPEVEAFAPEVCVHSAWITTPGVYLESPENERFRDTSLEFLRQVRARGTRHIVGVGTCIEYQITTQPLNETQTPIAPTTLYARCKNELRLALETAARSEQFTFAWMRVFYPYGPGEHPSRLCSSVVQKLRRGEKIELKTPHSRKDYIYIDDLTAAFLAVVERRWSGSVNLGTGIGISVKEIAGTLGRLLQRADLVQDAARLSPDPFPSVVADASCLKALGWHQQVSLEQGLQRLIESIPR